MPEERGRPFGGARQPDPGGQRMTQRTRAQERVDELDVSPTKLLADIEQLKGELETSRAKADEFLPGLQRERAAFTNYRRRTSEEPAAMLGLAGEDLPPQVLVTP